MINQSFFTVKPSINTICTIFCTKIRFFVCFIEHYTRFDILLMIYVFLYPIGCNLVYFVHVSWTCAINEQTNQSCPSIC